MSLRYDIVSPVAAEKLDDDDERNFLKVANTFCIMSNELVTYPSFAIIFMQLIA